jgi:glycosyltransferase involved in cell wall biosynthesis
VLVAASRDEGFGIPLVEAMALGVPVVASDIPVFREVAGSHARTFALAGGADSLAHALSEHRAHPPELAVLEAARQHALSFTWAAVAGRLWPVLESLAATRRP